VVTDNVSTIRVNAMKVGLISLFIAGFRKTPVLKPNPAGFDRSYWVLGFIGFFSNAQYTVMAEGSVCSVWHKSLANLPSITVDPLFPSFFVRRKLMKIQFFVRSFSIHPYIANHLCKNHTTVRHDCLHGMSRFHITFAKMAIS